MTTEKFKPSKDFIRNLPVYLRHDDFIDGQVERVEKYLIPHQTERSTKLGKTPSGDQVEVGSLMLSIRKERLENENFCNPILTYHLSYLAQNLTFSDALQADQWEEMLENIDGRGTGLKAFIADLVWAFISYGYVGCLVEGSARKEEGAVEARERGERSLAMIYEPWNILKLERFPEAGKYRFQISDLWLLESVEGEDNDQVSHVRRFWIDSQGSNYKSQRHTLAGNVLLVDGTAKSSDSAFRYKTGFDIKSSEPEVTGAFPKIPFETFGSGPIDSVIYTVVPRNRSYLNKKSAYDSTNYYQCFQRIAAFGIAPEELSAWAENLMAAFPNSDGKMQVVEAGNPVALKQDLDDIKRDAYLDGLLRSTLLHQMATKQQQSAESKTEDKSTFLESTNATLDALQKFTSDVLAWLWRFETSKDPNLGEVAVSFIRDFGKTKTEGELAEINLLISWLERFGGEAGLEAIGLILKSKFQKLELTVGENEDEGTVKDEIGSRILEAVKSNPGLRRFLQQRTPEPALRDRVPQ